MNEEEELPGTLRIGEFHPAAHIAYNFVDAYIQKNDVFVLLESLASCAIAGNRMADVAHETLRRFIHSEPVSDRYLMGLAWVLYTLRPKKGKKHASLADRLSDADS